MGCNCAAADPAALRGVRRQRPCEARGGPAQVPSVRRLLPVDQLASGVVSAHGVHSICQPTALVSQAASRLCTGRGEQYVMCVSRPNQPPS